MVDETNNFDSLKIGILFLNFGTSGSSNVTKMQDFN